VRRSTKAVFGICYPADATGVPIVDTAVPWPFTVYATTLKLTDASTLTQTFSTLPAYEDLLAASPSGVKPGRQETVITYSLDAATGKVRTLGVHACMPLSRELNRGQRQFWHCLQDSSSLS
jgi:hypothetical protein